MLTHRTMARLIFWIQTKWQNKIKFVRFCVQCLFRPFIGYSIVYFGLPSNIFIPNLHKWMLVISYAIHMKMNPSISIWFRRNFFLSIDRLGFCERVFSCVRAIYSYSCSRFVCIACSTVRAAVCVLNVCHLICGSGQSTFVGSNCF